MSIDQPIRFIFHMFTGYEKIWFDDLTQDFVPDFEFNPQTIAFKKLHPKCRLLTWTVMGYVEAY